MAIEVGTNHFLVSINGTMKQDVYNMIRRANLNPGSQININDYVNIVGRVVSIPRSICKRIDYKDFSIGDVEIGDLILFSYAVVGEIEELKGGNFRHKNSVVIKGKEYWRCDVRNVFAVIRSQNILMLNNYVMIDYVSQPLQLILPAWSKKVSKWATKTKIIAKGFNTNHLPINSETLVDYSKIQHYELNDKFGIIEAKHIYAIID